MAITFDANTTSPGNTPSWSHTVGTTSPFRGIIVGIGVVSENQSAACTGVTVGGVSCSLAVNYQWGVRYSWMYYLANPTTGSVTVSATLTGTIQTNRSRFCATSFYGVDQTTFFRSGFTATGYNNSQANSSYSGDLVYDFTTDDGYGAAYGWTAGANQTETLDFQIQYVGGVWSGEAASYELATGTSTTMSWDGTGAHISAAFKPYVMPPTVVWF